MQSWLVMEGKQTSQDEFQVRQVVKKATMSVVKKTKIVVKKEKHDGKKHQKEKIILNEAGSDIEDITEQYLVEENKMASSSEEDVEDIANNGLSTAEKLKDDITPLKRVPKLAVSQKLPYIGNSTVKRIIPGVITSTNDYDPMEVVEETKLRTLMEFIFNDE